MRFSDLISAKSSERWRFIRCARDVIPMEPAEVATESTEDKRLMPSVGERERGERVVGTEGGREVGKDADCRGLCSDDRGSGDEAGCSSDVGETRVARVEDGEIDDWC